MEKLPVVSLLYSFISTQFFFLGTFLLLFTKTLQSSLEQAIKCTDGWANRNKTEKRPSHKCEKVYLTFTSLFSLSTCPFWLHWSYWDICICQITIVSYFMVLNLKIWKKKNCYDFCQSSGHGINMTPLILCGFWLTKTPVFPRMD